MKKLVYLVLVLVPQWAIADLEKNQVAYDMMLSMMKSSSGKRLAETATCLGVSQAQLNGVVDRAMQRCFEQHKNEAHQVFTQSMEVCATPAIEKESGFSKADLERCEPKEEKTQRELAGLDIQIEALSEQLDQAYSSGASDSQIAALENKLEALENKYMDTEDALYGMAAAEDRVDDMQGVMQMVSQASEKSLHLITLPIYENSQVMMHMIDGNQVGVRGALPVATFSSKDEAEKILAYYRKKLPKFKYKDLGGGEHILMESMPDNFDLAEHMQTYVSTPHVFIRVLQTGSAMGAPVGTKSSIQVAYRERG